MDNGNLILRAARPQDRDRLVAILQRAWLAAFASHLSIEATQRYFAGRVAEQFVDAQLPNLRVAESEGKVLGLTHTDANLITALQVDPVYWHRGIGRALLNQAEMEIAGRSFAKVKLAVDDFNQRALAMYGAAGYIEAARTPDREFRSGTMSVAMHKNLPVAWRDWRATDMDAGLALFQSNVPRFFADSERQDFIDYIQAREGPYFVLEDAAGVTVGCGGYERAEDDPSTAVLCWGMIRGDRHGRGFGERLLRQRLDAIAADSTYRRVTIETTQHSRGFFSRHDFQETRRVRDGFAPGLDLVEMTLELDAYRWAAALAQSESAKS